MTADPPSSSDNSPLDADSDLEWGDDVVSSSDSVDSWASKPGEARDGGFRPKPVHSAADGGAPNLKSAPRVMAGPDKASGMVQNDVTQEGQKQVGRRDLEVQDVQKAFEEDLDNVDPRDVIAAKKKASAKSAFRQAEPMPKDDQAHLPETEMRAAVAPLPSTFSIKSMLFAVWGRSIFEKISWLVLLVLLVGFASLMFVPAIRDLPEEPDLFGSEDFPLQGDIVTLKSATTYWRVPVVGGADADMVRRGTKLIPVVELYIEGGPAAIRVLFRGYDGSLVGDMVTQPVEETRVLKIPATAGFDEVAMFAEYRTGKNEFWTVEVHEGGSVNDAPEDFKKLFEIKIQPILQP